MTDLHPPASSVARVGLAQREISARVAVGALAVLMLLASLVIYRKGLGTMFFFDEWEFVMDRQPWRWDVLLTPYNGPLSLLPVLVYKVLFATVGLGSYWVYRLVLRWFRRAPLASISGCAISRPATPRSRWRRSPARASFASGRLARRDVVPAAADLAAAACVRAARRRVTSVTPTRAAPAARLRAGARGWGEVARRRPLVLSSAALACLMLLESIVLFRKGFGLTFNYDEWNWVMNRRAWTAGTLLKPHNEHLSLVPVLVFKLLFVTVGIDSYWPYRLAVILVHLVCVALVFVLARRRVGDLFALALSASILFLGSAWQDLLWPFQIGYLASVAAGLGMLVALDRRDRTGRIWACVLLTVSIASSSLGLPFAALAIADLLLAGREPWRSPERWKRLWVVAAPVALYVVWFLAYGNLNATPGQAHGFGLFRQNGPLIPSYMADMAASAFAGLIGLAIDWGRPLVLLAIGFGIWYANRRRASARALSLLAGVLVLWGLTALLRAQLYSAGDSRYVYPGAVLLVLLLAEALRGTRATLRAGLVAATLVVFAAVGNYGPLKAGSLQFQDWSRYVRAELGALEIAGPSAPPTLAPDPMRAPDITADRYFAAVRQLGSPADTPEEIKRQGEPQREAADGVLAAGLRVGLQPTHALSSNAAPPPLESASGLRQKRDGGCFTLQAAAAGASAAFTVPVHGLVIDDLGKDPVEVRIRSFGDTFPGPLGDVQPGQSALLAIPARPGIVWHAEVLVPQRALVCGAR